MDILGISQAKFFGFFLILLRMGALFSFAPVFSSPVVPVRARAAAVLSLSLALSALGVGGTVEPPATLALLAFFVVQEMLLGLLLGLAARLVFAAVEFGGQLIGLQMGLGIVSVLDPQFETQVSIISQLQFLIATLLFLWVGGDRMLIQAFAGNLAHLPPGHPVMTAPAFRAIVGLGGEVFSLGLRMAAPVVVALLATQVVLGIFARSVPQMNMLILGFPIQFMLGFLVLGTGMSHWARLMLRLFSDLFEGLQALTRLVH